MSYVDTPNFELPCQQGGEYVDFTLAEWNPMYIHADMGKNSNNFCSISSLNRVYIYIVLGEK